MNALDQIFNRAEMFFIKYGATVTVHYLRMQRALVQDGVVLGAVDACIEHYCEML